jgi:DNA-binding NtrC family response regulator
MSEMSGKELSEKVLALSPQTKTLFAFAHNEIASANLGILKEAVAFLQKPYTPAALAQKVREALDHSKKPWGEDPIAS